VPICLLLGTLNTVTLSGHLIKNPQSENNSALAKMGKAMTPLFKPIGITQQNWPATVGLITGVMAKEVVVATLNTLYTEETLQSNEVTSRAKQLPSTEADSILHMLKNALQTIPDNLKNLGQGLGNPVLASAPEQTLTQSAYGRMYERFNGQTGAFAYLLFILLYFPCIASVAAMFRELNWRWGVFSMAWSTGMAYSVSTLFYQSATFSLHPLYSSISMGAVLLVLLMSIFMMRCYSIKGET